MKVLQRVGIVTLLAVWLSLMGGCSDAGTGPVEVHWDRDTCERCRMVLSDRKHSAQVRFTAENKRSRVRLFDDIGCAVIWLEDKPWKDAPGTEIWVTDHRDGHWIDARAAYYVKGQVTPMEYGLGAQPDKTENALDFNAAKTHIFEVEKRFNVHGAHLEAQAQERNTQ